MSAHVGFHYISPSALPSRSANSVHVMHQCGALCEAGMDVTLYAKRTIENVRDLPVALKENYGVASSLLNTVTFYSRSNRGDTVRIALMALKGCISSPGDIVLSRNLYAAFVLASLFHRPILFETHQLEYGIRKHLQRIIMTRSWVKTIVISNKLLEFLAQHHGVPVKNPVVLHDAAPAGIIPLPREIRRFELGLETNEDLTGWTKVFGYFGHLYSGRGMEIIEGMASKLPQCLFLVYGGNESNVNHCRENNQLINLRFMGHVAHPVAQRMMRSVDVLLMPYQREVSIGIAKHDTARWMSPMKMFEYMAAGVPIISSDLPVLREVLDDGANSLLVTPDDTAAWVKAAQRLIDDSCLQERLGENAHRDYLTHYTWLVRAKELIKVSQSV